MLDEPEAVRVRNTNAMGQHVPEIVMIIYKSANDEASPVNDTSLVPFYCDSGVRVEYLRDELSDHGTMALTGVPDVLFWLQDRMDGVHVDASWRTKIVLTGLTDPRALFILGTNMIQILGPSCRHKLERL